MNGIGNMLPKKADYEAFKNIHLKQADCCEHTKSAFQNRADGYDENNKPIRDTV